MILQVSRICLPLFGMIFLGLALRWRGMLTDQALTFLTRFVYLFSLPLLIYFGIASQDFGTLLNPAIIVSTLAVTGLLVVAAFASTIRVGSALRGPAIACTFVANVSYLGFPLAFNAFGQDGLTFAGIVNAFTMPAFVVLALLSLTLGHPGPDGQRSTVVAVRRGLVRTVTSPVFLAAALGVLTSLLLHETRPGAWLRQSPSVTTAHDLIRAILDPVCQVGLPLALLAVGGSLRLRLPHGHLVLVILCALAKLIVAPLLTLLICDWVFPGAAHAARGSAVLLMACPLGVSLFVFSKQFQANPDFVAGVLVVSTLGSCLTLPVWVAMLIR